MSGKFQKLVWEEIQGWCYRRGQRQTCQCSPPFLPNEMPSNHSLREYSQSEGENAAMRNYHELQINIQCICTHGTVMFMPRKNIPDPGKSVFKEGALTKTADERERRNVWKQTKIKERARELHKNTKFKGFSCSHVLFCFLAPVWPHPLAERIIHMITTWNKPEECGKRPLSIR